MDWTKKKSDCLEPEQCQVAVGLAIVYSAVDGRFADHAGGGEIGQLSV